MTPTSLLQIALVWQGKILAYRLVGSRQKVTVGPSSRASLVTPPVLGGGDRFKLLIPTRPRGRYRLRLTPSFRGDLTIKGEPRTVADLLVSGKPSARDAGIREVEIGPGDKASLTFEDAGGLRIEIRFVEPPPLVPRPRLKDTEPFLARTIASTSLVMGVFLAGRPHLRSRGQSTQKRLDRRARREVVSTGATSAARARQQEEGRREDQRRIRANEEGQGRQRPAGQTRRAGEGHRHPEGRQGHPARQGVKGRPVGTHREKSARKDRVWRNCSRRNATSSRRSPG